jgi:orotidine-5'-phosphate decarboxylase
MVKVLRSGIVVACDVDSLDILHSLVWKLSHIEGVVGFKVGASLAVRYGLRTIVEEIRSLTSTLIIYDHQKAGTDIPDTADDFVRACAESGADAVIVFPQAGPYTLRAYVKAVQTRSLLPIVGGEMTHAGYLSSDKGYVSDSAPMDIYRLAIDLGVSDLVVPGTRPSTVAQCVEAFSIGSRDIGYWCPGIGRQGGDAGALRRILRGKRMYAIVGRSIYASPDPKKAAQDILAELTE